ncbi:hypothetical protein BS50DRAFT_417535 [Corynespora cassiicola Philippines]|uniref:Uncharacterized protein n=1 Tax=Corynespora cassiicola Philippines TaxID=1448308 RepID=A0A2T2MZP8_CORCC|nr:hypothetical protein BS50DRAFT_417535 [Corynespora cassiicola Philippines]
MQLRSGNCIKGWARTEHSQTLEGSAQKLVDWTGGPVPAADNPEIKANAAVGSQDRSCSDSIAPTHGPVAFLCLLAPPYSFMCSLVMLLLLLSFLGGRFFLSIPQGHPQFGPIQHILSPCTIASTHFGRKANQPRAAQTNMRNVHGGWYVTALRTQPKVADAPPSDAYVCSWCEHQGRIFQSVDQLYSHAQADHPTAIQNLDPAEARARILKTV